MRTGLGAALFGRMVTSDPAANTDAAIHVAHAMTVHAMERDLDFMTVVDDLKSREEGDDAGAAVLYGAFAHDVTATVGADRIHHHELSIVGVFSHEPEDWRTSAGLLQSGALADDLDRLVTARFGLSEVAAAMELTVSQPVYRVLVG